MVVDAGARRELSEYLGHGTNNIAEPIAIERAAQLLEDAGDVVGLGGVLDDPHASRI